MLAPIKKIVRLMTVFTIKIKRLILAVCLRLERKIPWCLQPQCSFSHILLMVAVFWLFLLWVRSTIKPMIRPIKILMLMIHRISKMLAFSLIIIGSISSLVDRKIAIRVPVVMILLEKSFAAITLKPHWGIAPKSAPSSGPNF